MRGSGRSEIKRTRPVRGAAPGIPLAVVGCGNVKDPQRGAREQEQWESNQEVWGNAICYLARK